MFNITGDLTVTGPTRLGFDNVFPASLGNDVSVLSGPSLVFSNDPDAPAANGFGVFTLGSRLGDTDFLTSWSHGTQTYANGETITVKAGTYSGNANFAAAAPNVLGNTTAFLTDGSGNEYSNYNTLSVTVVPEPAHYAWAAALGLVGFAFLRRRLSPSLA